MNVLHRRATICITLAVLMILIGGLATPATTTLATSATSSTSATAATGTTSALDFRNAMRQLWEDHVTWTRMYIVSALANQPDKDATAQRLLRNQEDIGNAIKPFYGDAAGDKLTALLKDHILEAATLLEAAKGGDNKVLQAASDAWYANANDIAAFLNSANPKAWPLDVMQMGMKMHLDMTLQEAVTHLKGDYTADVADYDKVYEHILGLADTVSAGIMSQFPDRFTAAPSDADVSLHQAMRKLWEDHITWTRLFILSAAADSPDKDATTQRLLQNQVDLGNAIKPYYGDAAGDKLTALLRDHILGAASLLTAAKAGDNAAVQAASDAWYANANDIAAFLNSANPNGWPLDAMQMSMKMHLDQTLTEAVDRLKGDYAADIADYDKVQEHILMMADALSDGIVSQFPDNFSGATVAGMPRTGGAQGYNSAPLAWLLTLGSLALVAMGLWVLRRGVPVEPVREIGEEADRKRFD
ncbi:MAG: hypothetical protein ABI670_18335 [Chloroflexota bacterium]